MKMISKIGFSLVTATLLFVGCGESPAAPAAQKAAPATQKVAPQANSGSYKGIQVLDESTLGYRKSSLYNERNSGVMASSYSKAAPGTSNKIQRAFQDAPPMIPHDTEGMLIITKDNNQCLQCHKPEVAEMVGATSIPKSHFLNMRPVNKIVDGKLVYGVDNLKNQVSIKKITKVYEGRFNCVQCHAPQSNAALITENKFQPQYLSDDGAFRSHWDEQVEKSLDTVGKDSDVTAEDIANKNSQAGSLHH
ncbi:MAG: nitrate reductase cytochrome c-type subunit [Sulfurimonas sp.]